MGTGNSRRPPAATPDLELSAVVRLLTEWALSPVEPEGSEVCSRVAAKSAASAASARSARVRSPAARSSAALRAASARSARVRSPAARSSATLRASSAALRATLSASSSASAASSFPAAGSVEGGSPAAAPTGCGGIALETEAEAD